VVSHELNDRKRESRRRARERRPAKGSVPACRWTLQATGKAAERRDASRPTANSRLDLGPTIR
jgi:hypothetical protein